MADDIRDRIRDGLPPDDRLVVMDVCLEASWHGLTVEEANWIVEDVGHAHPALASRARC
jgi:hypothetical protein